MPKGFVASKATGENTVKDGFVIYQGTEDVTDANKDTAMTTRNQFVWVPVPDPSKMFTTHEGKNVGRLYNFDTSSKTYTEIAWSNTGYREPDILTDSTDGDVDANLTAVTGVTTQAQLKTQLETEFAEMKASIEKYKGFYIGRYETGVGEKIIKGVEPLVNKTWYELYQISKDMINANGIKSGMIWGSQWDQTMIWFDTQGGEKKNYVYDSTGKGNYGINVTSTGSSTDYAVNNIYDMAGNGFDWSLDAYGHGKRVHRGGRYTSSGIDNPASHRVANRPTDSNDLGCARSTLVI